VARVLTQTERRDFSRIALRRPATLEVSGATAACELLDISLRGALIRVPRRLAAAAASGQPCTLVVRLDEGIATLRMRGVVAHRSEVTIGLRCRELDLDAIGHLRRLLEVHLTEERLIHREMGALLARRVR